MLKSIEGIFRDDKVEFLEPPPQTNETRVLVTFLSSGFVHLSDKGISEAQAADLRGHLRSFAEDWDRPDMDVYDSNEVPSPS
jgi:hypothetical protein